MDKKNLIKSLNSGDATCLDEILHDADQIASFCKKTSLGDSNGSKFLLTKGTCLRRGIGFSISKIDSLFDEREDSGTASVSE